MSSSLELISAISSGNAVDIESAFNSAMAEKISGQLDAMRANIAKGMFSEQPVQEEVETITEEEYQNLTEEEQAQYEIVEGIIKKIGNVANKAVDAVGDAAKAVGSIAGKVVGGAAKTAGAVRQAPSAIGNAYNRGRAGAQKAIDK